MSAKGIFIMLVSAVRTREKLLIIPNFAHFCARKWDNISIPKEVTHYQSYTKDVVWYLLTSSLKCLIW